MRRFAYLTLVGLPALLVLGVVGYSAKWVQAYCNRTRLGCVKAIRYVMAAAPEKKSAD